MSANLENERRAASVSSQEIGIGQCLLEALKTVKRPSEEIEEGVSNIAQQPARKKLKNFSFDAEEVNRIMMTFGESVADTQLDPKQSEETTAPRALLKGRLDNYNRVRQNWRIVADAPKLSERRQLRRDTKRSSLWGDSNERNEISLDSQLQILAYNDV